MLIEVTEEHISKGKYNCLECPISLAISEKTGRQVSTGSTAVWIEDRRFPLNRKCLDFVFLFDHKIKVEPFSFNLDFDKGEING